MSGNQYSSHEVSHDISSPESAVEFAPGPGERSGASSAMSTASMSKVEKLLGAGRVSPPSKEKRRPPALHHQRSHSSDPRQRSQSSNTYAHARKDSTSDASGLGGISVSSTIYPVSGAAARESFIDLDDGSPSYSESRHHDRPRRSGEGAYADDELSIDSRASSDFYANVPRNANPNAMYPTPTRAGFKNRSRPSTAYSDTSQLPKFAEADRESVAYQPITPTPRRRQRPQSMLATPTPTANFFFDYTDELERGRPKPPLPKSPKPTQFLRKAAAASSSSSPKDQRPFQQPLPPMTNTRDPGERLELIRKHRKLAQVFGEGVGGMLWPTDDPHAVRTRVRGVVPPSSHRKGSLSADVLDEGRAQVLTVPPARRHSTPTSAEFGDYAIMVHAAQEQEDGDTNPRPRRSGSPESFMELSDDEEHDVHRGDDASSTLSQSPEATAEQERKKMRDKLAKLHRFLGSRVPVELALGAEYALRDQDLPKPAPVAASPPSSDREGETRDGAKGWIRRRRSSSSAALPGYVIVHSPSGSSSVSGPAADERMKDELGEKERAINLKRANKMEQMFGTRPPPTLYQTRPARAPSPSPHSSGSTTQPPELPVLPPVEHNPNTSAYKGKGRRKRPGTSESSQALLGEDGAGEGISHVYMYYRHSLNSLTDIIDKDDKESLAELHQYINAPSGSDEETTPVPANFPFGSSLERRRSLPARTSMQSIASTLTIALPEPDPSGFQQRRRRAAKLTNFFGVNYRDLFGEVLASIEMGMQDEVSAGSLQAAELEELMGKLRKLKVRRDEITG